MIRTSVGQILVNHALPPDMRDFSRRLDKKGTTALFDDLARKHPDKYPAVAKRLMDVARRVAYDTGGFSFSLEHMQPTRAGTEIKARTEREIDAILMRAGLSDADREKQIVDVLQKASKEAEEKVFGESLAEDNPLAHQVLNVGRGNKSSLKGLRAGDYLYEDHHGNPIAIPALRSYAQGLHPVEYWAAAFGARKGVAATKFATQQAGFFAKQLVQAAHRLVVTAHDAEEDNHDHKSPRGLPVATSDPHNEGAVLAAQAGPYQRNTLLTGKVLKHLTSLGHDQILVRSPMVGGPPDGGVYSRDVGVRERGALPPRGDFVGIAAAQALSEKLTQGQLSAKHSGGVAGADQAVSGFKAINQLVQVPKVFHGGAAHAQLDGRVGAIEPAPQGGTYIHVGGQRHYAGPGLQPLVKPGDDVEAGDVLSWGIPNPAEIVRHKGIGEGRNYFVKTFGGAFKNSGMYADRRNIELLARGLINHVRLTEEVGDYIPDDVVPYQRVEASWEPREDAREASPHAAVGKYLEKPVLHYTIGTRITPSMLPRFKDFGVDSLLVHDQPPPFKPEMIRGMATLQYDQDWMTRHLGSNLQRSTLEAAHRGRGSDPLGTSYVPAIAERTSFGRRGLTRGWSPSDLRRDGDGDGKVGDGTAQEAPAPRAPAVAGQPRRPSILSLL